MKFLNQTGGGIVTKVTDDFVFVQDDTGFDIPMQPEELIRMADMQGAGKMFNAAMEEHLKGKGTSLPSAMGPAAKAALNSAQPLTPEEEGRNDREEHCEYYDGGGIVPRELGDEVLAPCLSFRGAFNERKHPRDGALGIDARRAHLYHAADVHGSRDHVLADEGVPGD